MTPFLQPRCHILCNWPELKWWTGLSIWSINSALTVWINKQLRVEVCCKFMELKPRSHSADAMGNISTIFFNAFNVLPTLFVFILCLRNSASAAGTFKSNIFARFLANKSSNVVCFADFVISPIDLFILLRLNRHVITKIYVHQNWNRKKKSESKLITTVNHSLYRLCNHSVQGAGVPVIGISI